MSKQRPPKLVWDGFLPTGGSNAHYRLVHVHNPTHDKWETVIEKKTTDSLGEDAWVQVRNPKKRMEVLHETLLVELTRPVRYNVRPL